MTTTLRLKDPADIVAMLPYDLGFHPQDSLVLLGLCGTRLGLRARVDLPPPQFIQETVASLLPPLLETDATDVLLIGYERTIGDSMPMLEAMEDGALEAGLSVKERLVVRDGRLFSIDCRDARCCPPEGRPLSDPADVPAVAELVARERAPVADRASLAASLRTARPLLAAAVAREVDTWSARVAASSGRADGRAADEAAEVVAWARVLDVSDDAVAVGDLPADTLALAADALRDVQLRDALIAWLCPGMLPSVEGSGYLTDQLRTALPRPSAVDETAAAVGDQRTEARLVELCRCLTPDLAVAPLVVLAAVTWWKGDGALTRMALELALETAPSYRLALLLLRMVDLSIRPDRGSVEASGPVRPPVHGVDRGSTWMGQSG